MIRHWLLTGTLLLLSLWWSPGAALFIVPIFYVSGCCCSTCAVFSDDFATDRTGTADYSIRTGTWTVATGKLSCTTASALIREEASLSGSATGVYTSVTIKMTGGSDIGRLGIAYTNDSNYWFIELQPGSDGTLTLFQRSGGTNTQVGDPVTVTSLNNNDEVDVTFCYDGTKLKATAKVGASARVQLIHTASVTVASTKSILGTGAGSSSVTFDNFVVTKHHVDDSTCNQCLTVTAACTGCSATIPERLQVVLPALTNSGCTSCASFAGTYICDYIGFDSFACQWVYYFPPGTSPCSNYDRLVVVMDYLGSPFPPSVSILLTNATLSIDNQWRKAYGATPDCTAWASESIATRSNTLGLGNCIHALVSPLPAFLTSL